MVTKSYIKQTIAFIIFPGLLLITIIPASSFANPDKSCSDLLHPIKPPPQIINAPDAFGRHTLAYLRALVSSRVVPTFLDYLTEDGAQAWSTAFEPQKPDADQNLDNPFGKVKGYEIKLFLEFLKLHFLPSLQGNDKLNFIDLGSGDGETAMGLIEGIHNEYPNPIHYMPVDVSNPLLEMVRGKFSDRFLISPSLTVDPTGDFLTTAMAMTHLAKKINRGSQDNLPGNIIHNLFLFFGQTFGNFPSGTRREFLHRLSEIAPSGSIFALAVDTYDPNNIEKLIIRYRSPQKVRVALGPLLSMGLDSRDFRYEVTWDPIRLSIIGYYVINRDIQIFHKNREVGILPSGARVHHFQSKRFIPEEIESLAEGTGFRLVYKDNLKGSDDEVDGTNAIFVFKKE